MKNNTGALTGSHRSNEAPSGLRPPRAARSTREEAIDLCEQFIGQVLVAHEVSETLLCSTSWQRLKFTPVRSIAQPINLMPADYGVDIDSAGDGWIRFTTTDANYPPISIRYTAGLAFSFDEVPEPLKAGIERLERHLETDPKGDPPAVVTALWRPYRRLRV